MNKYIYIAPIILDRVLRRASSRRNDFWVFLRRVWSFSQLHATCRRRTKREYTR